MLKQLHIKNFAIIDQLELHFEFGLITFTGETGAGKSIILDALNTLLGSRADSTFIRSGSDGALIEATFRIPSVEREKLHAILDHEDLLDDPDYITLGREVRRDSRNTARVNGRSTSVRLLTEIGDRLVDIHGQSEHLSLLQVREHLNLLDRYADLGNTFTRYKSSYRQLLEVQKELATLRRGERAAAQRADLLDYQIDEIEAANLQPNEEKELKQERDRLANSEKISSLVQKVLHLLDENTSTTTSITTQLGGVIEALNKLVKFDASQNQIKEQATASFEELSEISHDLHLYIENVEFDPKRLDFVEERLDLINHLKRKYGDTIAEVLAFGHSAKQELDAITHASERIIELESKEQETLSELGKRAEALSRKRHSAAEKLQTALETELDDLRMPKARFRINFQPETDPNGIILANGERVAFNADGYEQVEFFIETNPGEGLKPLVKVASGGETSRLMLALKNVLADADHVPTLIFDEIDQGIGGRVGAIVGHKLWLLAQKHQVLCITHLPQLAAFGHQHFRVIKEIEDGRTITQAKAVEGEARLRELAQMLGEVSENTLRSAQGILQIAQQQIAK
ncbi:MAG: DNA repair protein RecN [Chloroflexota bacterium]|nr:DNA repair protein RecN [Chloroflexota bacterium]